MGWPSEPVITWKRTAIFDERRGKGPWTVALALFLVSTAGLLTGCGEEETTAICTDTAQLPTGTVVNTATPWLNHFGPIPTVAIPTSEPTTAPETPPLGSIETGLVLPIKDPVYYNGYGIYSWGKHIGYDIKSLSGNRTVYSMGSGTVIDCAIPANRNEDHYIRVQMDAGYYIQYVHIETSNLARGSRVEPDTVIGQYGAVGNVDPSDFDHLHIQFESPILQHIDPGPYWPGGAPSRWLNGSPQ